MKRDEFRKRLDQLHEVLFRGLLYYTVWKNLALHDPSRVSWSLQEQNEVLARFPGFFTPVAQALRDMALLEFAKLFDKDPRTASLPNLRRAARQDPSLVPNARAGDVDEHLAQLQQSYERVLAALKRKRDQQLAHIDVEPLPVGPIRNTEFDKLVEDAKSAFNSLSTAHDGRYFSWESSLQTADWHTTEMLRTVVEETREARRSISRSVRQSRLD